MVPQQQLILSRARGLGQQQAAALFDVLICISGASTATCVLRPKWTSAATKKEPSKQLQPEMSLVCSTAHMQPQSAWAQQGGCQTGVAFGQCLTSAALHNNAYLMYVVVF
jgi:hypothetical protein